MGKGSCYRGGHFNLGRMVMLRRWTLMGGRMVILQRWSVQGGRMVMLQMVDQFNGGRMVMFLSWRV